MHTTINYLLEKKNTLTLIVTFAAKSILILTGENDGKGDYSIGIIYI